MARTTIRSEDIADSEITSAKIADTGVAAGDLAGTLDLSSKTVTLPAASVTAHVTAFDDNQLKEDIALLGFKAATNGSLAKYDLIDQTEDIFQDASGVDASASTGETRNASKYYSGVTDGTTGGTKTTYTSGGVNYVVRTFLANGNLVIPSAGTFDVLMVAGGASGGCQHAGGAGAGGMIVMPGLTAAATTYAAVIGAGGTPEADSVGEQGDDGDNTTFFGETAVGGGGGGYYHTKDGRTGGSGGGGSGGSASGNPAGGSGTQGDPTSGTGYGNNGGGSQQGYSHAGGGGGGAGAVGADATGSGSAGNGGVGLANNYRTGSDVFYAGGGGGGVWSGTKGLGGNGGGGNGSDNFNADNAVSGTANTGGGGGAFGGQSTYGTAGAGGSGIVVVRWVDSQFTDGADMTLVSNSTTAETQATKADFVMTVSAGVGTLALGDGTNGDVRAFVSRDNGTTYTQFTLADQGDTGGHTILTSHDLSISGQPAGTAMRYKITTHNQSASKETRVQAVSLGWS